MAATKIEWADKAWNPITGCTPVSEGCRNCYARRMARRLRGRFGYPADEPFRPTIHNERFGEPFRWRKGCSIFVCSMGDLFHPDIDTAAIVEIAAVMRACPRHRFMVLTKRPERLVEAQYSLSGGWPLGEAFDAPNIAVGVSASNQQDLERWLPPLVAAPLSYRFVSLEPLLGAVDLTLVRWPHGDVENLLRRQVSELARNAGIDKLNGLDWVIVGGETGPGARPMDADWARWVREQCKTAGIPFFFKQMGRGAPTPPDLAIREFPQRD